MEDVKVSIFVLIKKCPLYWPNVILTSLNKSPLLCFVLSRDLAKMSTCEKVSLRIRHVAFFLQIMNRRDEKLRDFQELFCCKVCLVGNWTNFALKPAFVWEKNGLR